MKSETGTTFTEQSTQHGNEGKPVPSVTMMSSLGGSLASVSAPSSAFVVSTKSTSAVKES